MARSVYVPADAAVISYVALDNKFYEDFDDWQEIIRDEVQAALPSMYSCREWEGREGFVPLKNKFCKLVIAEYCGLVSVSLVPYGEKFDLGWKWAESVKAKIDMAAGVVGDRLLCEGAFSNGEAFFEPVGE